MGLGLFWPMQPVGILNTVHPLALGPQQGDAFKLCARVSGGLGVAGDENALSVTCPHTVFGLQTQGPDILGHL